MLAYFATLAVLGTMYVVTMPSIILETINPLNAVQFFIADGFRAFVAMGSVVLAVTGAEALYADMGHFGRKPIGVSWLTIVLPCLMLNYMGQGAMVLSAGADAGALIKDPFFLMIPDAVRIPVIILAMAATIIASQAVISGAFSLTQQAIQLGFIPRMQIKHTSASAAGQIYIPVVNWGLMMMVIILVLFFQSSSNLAAAYGIAVTGAMFIDTFLLAAVLFRCGTGRCGRPPPLIAIFFVVDMAYLGANLIKVPDGGWVPLTDGAVHLHPADHLVARAAADARARWPREPADRRSSPRARRTARRACPARRSSCPLRPTGCPRRCCTTSSTTRCCTSAWW